MGRHVTLDLNPTLSRFLQQEKSRLHTTYGMKFTDKEIFYALLEQHRLRVVSEADEKDAMLWYYDQLKEHDRAS